VRRLAVAPDIDWVDFQSRHDIMNFWPFDPVAGHGIALGPNGETRTSFAISFRDIWRRKKVQQPALALLPGPFPVPTGQ